MNGRAGVCPVEGRPSTDRPTNRPTDRSTAERPTADRPDSRTTERPPMTDYPTDRPTDGQTDSQNRPTDRPTGADRPDRRTTYHRPADSAASEQRGHVRRQPPSLIRSGTSSHRKRATARLRFHSIAVAAATQTQHLTGLSTSAERRVRPVSMSPHGRPVGRTDGWRASERGQWGPVARHRQTRKRTVG